MVARIIAQAWMLPLSAHLFCRFNKLAARNAGSKNGYEKVQFKWVKIVPLNADHFMLFYFCGRCYFPTHHE